MRKVTIIAVQAFLIFFASLSGHFAVAQNKAMPPRDGVWQVFHPVGKYLVREESYKDGLRHGPSLHFDMFGLVSEANYVEGKLDGFWRGYEQGNLASEIFYKSGKAEGASFVRRKDFEMTGQYRNGKRDGVWLEKRPGKWEFVKRFKDGLPDGIWERKTKGGLGDLLLTYEKGRLVSKLEDIKSLPYYQKVRALAADGKDPIADYALTVLEQDADLDYPQTPVKEVVEDWKERFGVPMYVDTQAAGMSKMMELPTTVNDQAIPMFIGMHDVATQHGMTFDYRFHAFWLTTPKSLAAWKDTTGVSDLKPAAESPLAKALPEPLKFDLLGTSLDKLAEPLKKHLDVELDASKAADAEWYDTSTRPGPDLPKLNFRDALFTILYLNHCRCREQDGKLIIEPLPGKSK